MPYIPKMPPFAAREKALGVSLPGEIPVTSVTEVTQDRSSNQIEAVGVAVADRPEIVDLLNQWLRARCVLSSWGASSVRALHRSFVRWAKFEPDAHLEHMFARDLQVRGYTPDKSGMIQGLVLAADYLIGLEYERADKSSPAIDGRNSLMKGATDMTMVITNKQKQFEIPTEGEHLAVLADIVDLGETEFDYGPRERIQLVWLVEQRGKDGKPLLARQKPHNKSMHEKSTLRKDIKRILGKDPGESFDVDFLLGVNSLLEIEHSSGEGRTFANIVALRRPTTGERVLKVPEDFKRAPRLVKRKRESPSSESTNIHGIVATDDDIEF